MPPRIKILEAFGALADDRVAELGEGFFSVISSDGTRTYRVYVERVGQKEFLVCSTDNGTVFRGYVGYPIISAMMLSRYLRRDPEIEEALARIPWRRLNETLKKYSLVESEVLRLASSRGVDSRRINFLVSMIINEMRELAFLYDRSKCGAGVGEEEEGTD